MALIPAARGGGALIRARARGARRRRAFSAAQFRCMPWAATGCDAMNEVCAPRAQPRRDFERARALNAPAAAQSARARPRVLAASTCSARGSVWSRPRSLPLIPLTTSAGLCAFSTASCAPSESRRGLRNADRRAAEAARVLSWRRGAARTPTGRKPASRTRPGVACTLETEVPGTLSRGTNQPTNNQVQPTKSTPTSQSHSFDPP